MARLSEKARSTLGDIVIIVGGLLLSFVFLTIICTAVIVGPFALLGLVIGMMGPPY